ncbi:MAG: universal stress protein [Bacteroidota bacterium]
MNKIRKIIIPTDFSEAAENALNYVAGMIENDDVIEIFLLHISDKENTLDEETVNQKLDILKQKFFTNIQSKCNCVLKTGQLTNTIIQAKDELAADLIIMGTEGGEEIFGSKTAQLVLEADCPVLVVPENTTSFRVKNIALAMDDSLIEDSYALGPLQDIARRFGAKIHVLTISKKDEVLITEGANEGVLEYYLETLDYHHAFPKNTNIEEGIRDYVKENKIDMLAILPRNHAHKDSPSEGRLTKLLTLHTEVPLLTLD